MDVSENNEEEEEDDDDDESPLKQLHAFDCLLHQGQGTICDDTV
jgi:hypothetical protein